MSIIVRKPDYNSGGFEERVAPDALVQDFLRWLLETRRWQEDPEYFDRKFRVFRRDLWETALPVPVVGDEPEEDEEVAIIAPEPPVKYVQKGGKRLKASF